MISRGNGKDKEFDSWESDRKGWERARAFVKNDGSFLWRCQIFFAATLASVGFDKISPPMQKTLEPKGFLQYS